MFEKLNESLKAMENEELEVENQKSLLDESEDEFFASLNDTFGGPELDEDAALAECDAMVSSAPAKMECDKAGGIINDTIDPEEDGGSEDVLTGDGDLDDPELFGDELEYAGEEGSGEGGGDSGETGANDFVEGLEVEELDGEELDGEELDGEELDGEELDGEELEEPDEDDDDAEMSDDEIDELVMNVSQDDDPGEDENEDEGEELDED